jgi:uncharacterized protein involved in exopolysaccharide biosynthesis
MKDNEIDLNDFFKILWHKKKLILIFTVLSAFISVIYSLSLTNFYTSSALLAPQKSQSTLGSNINAISPLADVVGISAPRGDDTTKAIERMKSYDFFVNFFIPNINVEDLASIRFSNIDDKIPTDQELYKIYKKVFSVSQSKKTNFVNVNIQHYNPNIAKAWLDIIISQINQSMMKQEILVAQDSISFLNDAAQNTNIAELREAIAKLLGSQMQKLMLASSNDSYVFVSIDPPIAPETKSSPARALICIIGTITGFFISIIYLLIETVFTRNQKN